MLKNLSTKTRWAIGAACVRRIERLSAPALAAAGARPARPRGGGGGGGQLILVVLSARS